MQTILVPTNFSPNSYNAARYAIALAADIKASTIILYHAFQPYVSDDPELGLPIQFELEEFKQLSEEGLIKQQQLLQAETTGSIEVKYDSDYNTINNGIEEACKKYSADLIVIGINGAESKLEETIIGSTAIDVAKHSEVPLIIVPSNGTYNGLKKVLLALDFKKVADTTPVAAIKKLLETTNAKLDVLHVEAEANNNKPTVENVQDVFDTLFSDYNPQYHFIQGENFAETINSFAAENNTDLVIVIPKKHGLFDGIFKQSHTKALAFHSHVPIMTIHE